MQEIVSRKDVVTIREVAEAAGVSLSSVSRALNGGKNVSAKVARDVAAAANRLGYQPDLLASIVRAAEARLREAGYLLVVAITANDPERERSATGEFRRRRLDGMLIAPGSDANRTTWRELSLAGTPVVV